MRRAAKIAAWVTGAIVGTVFLLVALVLIAANTTPGQRFIAEMATKLSGGTITLQGLSGRFPDRLRVAHLDLRDGEKAWLSIDQLSLDWSPLALLRGDVHIARLAAAVATFERLPAPSQTPAAKSGGGLPPIRIDVDDVDLPKLTIGAAVAQQTAVVRLAGELHLRSMQQGSVGLQAERLDATGHYAVSGTLEPDRVTAQIEANEPAQGLLAGLADISNIGPISLNAQIDGPRTAESLRLALSAGALRADGQGTLDLVQQHIDLDLTASAPDMAPRPDLHWQAAKLDAHIHGSFTQPEANGVLTIEKLTSGTAALSQINATFAGTRGKLDLDAALADLHLPAPTGDLFAAAPLQLHVEAELDDPTRPATFALTHPLLTLAGHASSAGKIAGSVDITLPQLDAFAALAGVAIGGDAHITSDFSVQGQAAEMSVNGNARVTGQGPAALLGESAQFALAATRDGQDITLQSAQIVGKSLRASAQGRLTGESIAGQWSVALADLAPLASTLSGSASAKGELRGTLEHLSLSANADAQIGAGAIRPTPVTLSLRLDDLPNAPAGQMTAQGDLLGSPLALAVGLRRESSGALRIAIDRAQWKSANAEGEVSLARGATIPLGRMQLHMTRLEELAPLTGTRISGSVNAWLETQTSSAKTQLNIALDGQKIAIEDSAIDQISATARVADPLGQPLVAGQLRVGGINANGVSGKAELDVDGPIAALPLHLGADLQTSTGPVRLSASAKANLPQKSLQLTALEATASNETLRLLGPATIKAASGFAVQGLQLGVGSAVLTADGAITPKLDLSVALRNVTPALAKPFAPALDAVGTLGMNAKLGGTVAAPTGTIHVTGQGLQWRNGAARGIAAATLDATAALRGDRASLDAKLTAGNSVNLRLSGDAPLQAAAAFDLRSTGKIDLVVLDPLLTPNGRSARGELTLDLGFAGTLASRHLSGSASLAKGAIHDYAQGIDIVDMAGTIAAEGDTLRIAKLTGQAGSGNLSLAGTIGALAPDMPIDLMVTLQNARLPASDLLTAQMSGALTLQGHLASQLDLAGQIKVARADINIPESLPQSVAVLEVRRPGQAPPTPSSPGVVIGFGLGVDAPQQIFVHGHGVDAELGGSLQVAGTSAAPRISGGFNLRRGTFSLAGQTLNFTRGKVSFNGTSPSGKLDPSLELVAETTSNNVTATLTVSGYADAPKIQLSSTPELPQDEILAQLLFKQSVKQLTPLQVAQIAQALAALSGVGGGGDPLAGVRKGLGLDRLSVGAASGNTSGATVEAGKYVANGVYVGTKQGTGGGTQGQVQIDLTKNLKLETTLGAGGGAPATGATPDNDPGSSVGLTYQLEY